MDNVSNGDSCIRQLTSYKLEEIEEELIDPKEVFRQCKALDAEIDYYINKVIKKAEIRYNYSKDKETYDQLIHLKQALKN